MPLTALHARREWFSLMGALTIIGRGCLRAMLLPLPGVYAYIYTLSRDTGCMRAPRTLVHLYAYSRYVGVPEGCFLSNVVPSTRPMPAFWLGLLPLLLGLNNDRVLGALNVSAAWR